MQSIRLSNTSFKYKCIISTPQNYMAVENAVYNYSYIHELPVILWVDHVTHH